MLALPQSLKTDVKPSPASLPRTELHLHSQIVNHQDLQPLKWFTNFLRFQRTFRLISSRFIAAVHISTGRQNSALHQPLDLWFTRMLTAKANGIWPSSTKIYTAASSYTDREGLKSTCSATPLLSDLYLHRNMAPQFFINRGLMRWPIGKWGGSISFHLRHDRAELRTPTSSCR